MMHDAVVAVFVMMPLMFGSMGVYFAIIERKLERCGPFIAASIACLVLLALLTRSLFSH